VWQRIGLSGASALFACVVAAGLCQGAVPEYLVDAWQVEDGLPQNTVTCMTQTRDGYLWLGTYAGLVRFDGARFVVFGAHNTRAIRGNRVLSILVDRHDRLWIGTEGTGLLRLKPRRLATLKASDGLAGDTVLSIAETDDGGVLISTRRGGISRFADGTVTPWTADGAIPHDIGAGPLLRTRDGSLWIGTSGKGLFRWRNGDVRHFGRDEGLSDTAILALYEHHAGGLWIGTYDAGLFLYQEGRFRRFTAADGFPAQIVTALTEDRDGDLWIGSDGMGLYRYANGRFSYFCRREGWGNDFIKALHVDADGAVWIGSGGGLTRMEDGWFATLTTAHGLIDDVVTQILEDDDGRLWLGTNRGRCGLIPVRSRAPPIRRRPFSSRKLGLTGKGP